mgnify:CR=1 FL=1
MKIVNTSPAVSAVTLAEAKSHCRIYDDDEDPAVDRMGLAATYEFEAQAQIAPLTRTVTLRLDGWPADGRILLPVGPVLDGASATVTADGEAVTGLELLPGRYGELRLSGGVTAELAAAEIVIEYPAGYGANESDVPADIRHAILDQVAALYDMRGAPSGREMAVSPHLLRIAAKARGVRI